PAVVRRRLAIVLLALLGAVVPITLASWEPGRTEIVVGTNAALATVTAPLPLAVFLLALAGVGIPAVGSRPGPVRWALTRAAWVVAGLPPVTLLLANRSYKDSGSAYAEWYQTAVSVPFAAGLGFFVVCLWLLRRLSRAAPAGRSERATRIRANLAT